MPPDQPPRRRITDHDRRRWNDKALDLLGERVESHAEDIEEVKAEARAVNRLPSEMAAFRREFEEWKTERREDLTQLRKNDEAIQGNLNSLGQRIDTLFDRNFREHREVKATADEIAKTVKPTSMSKVRDFVTYVSVLIVPFLLTYLTIVLVSGR